MFSKSEKLAREIWKTIDLRFWFGKPRSFYHIEEELGCLFNDNSTWVTQFPCSSVECLSWSQNTTKNTEAPRCSVFYIWLSTSWWQPWSTQLLKQDVAVLFQNMEIVYNCNFFTTS